MSEKEKSRDALLRVLFRKYRKIRELCDEHILQRYQNAKDYYESFEWFENLMEGKDPDKLIEELQHTSETTERIICHIDRTVEKYGEIARQEGITSWREYDALYSRYFSSHFSSPKEISRKFGVKKSTVYGDMKHAETRLVTMLFDDSATDGISLDDGNNND